MSLFFLSEAGEDSFGAAGDDIASSADSMGGGQEVSTNNTSSTDGNQDDQSQQQDGQDETQQDGSDDGGEDSFGAAGDDISNDADSMGSEDTSAGAGSTPDASGGMGTENEVKLNPFIKLKYIKKLTHMKIILVDTIKLVSKMTEDEISDEIKLFIINSATSINEKISLILSMKVNELEADNLEKIYIAFEGKVSIINDLLKSYRNKDDDKDKKKKSSKSKKDKSDKEDEKDNEKDSKKSSK